MSVGFGFSVGDFIAALQLVNTVIQSLRDAGGSSTVYQQLAAELETLKAALEAVGRLDPDSGQRNEKIALHQAAAQCKRTIDEFAKKIQKYQPHLGEEGSGSRLKDSWAKIRWAVCKKEDLQRFRADIRGHTGAIQILLLAVNVEAVTIQDAKQGQESKTLAGKIQDFSSQWFSKASAITDGMTQSVHQGKALLEATTKIVQTNLRVFQMVFDIHQFIFRVPAQVNRQQPVYMIDAFGKESPFHLEFVRSAEALIAILKVNFKSTESGPQMIEQGEFVIEDDGTKRDVNLANDWDTCFFPGQRVSMSMVFNRSNKSPSCPSCGAMSNAGSGQETVWYVFTTIQFLYHRRWNGMTHPN